LRHSFPRGTPARACFPTSFLNTYSRWEAREFSRECKGFPEPRTRFTSCSNTHNVSDCTYATRPGQRGPSEIQKGSRVIQVDEGKIRQHFRGNLTKNEKPILDPILAERIEVINKLPVRVRPLIRATCASLFKLHSLG